MLCLGGWDALIISLAMKEEDGATSGTNRTVMTKSLLLAILNICFVRLQLFAS
jgi:hypothetical protein